MKTLLLMRHAKSSWGNPDLDDHDRALNKRGQRAAPMIGNWIRANRLMPDLALVSDARRTRETWTRMGLEGCAVQIRADLYHASPDTSLDLIRGAQGDRLLILGHNPGIGLLAQALPATVPDHPKFAQFPTAAVLVLHFDTDDWRTVGPRGGRNARFVTPHDLA